MNYRFPYYDVSTGVDWNQISQFDWFQDMHNTKQDSVWHAEGDVATHTQMVVETLFKLDEFIDLNEQDKHIVVMSCLFHDIGKITTTTMAKDYDDNERYRVIAPGHSRVSEIVTRELLYKQFDVPFKIREEICSLVRYHGVPTWSLDDDNVHLKLIQISQRCRLNLLELVARADVLGRVCNDSKQLLENVSFFAEYARENECYTRPKHLINNRCRFRVLNDTDYNPHYDVSANFLHVHNTRFQVHMISGIAGSGKDSYIKRTGFTIPSISLDDIRREYKIKPTDKKGNGRVYQEAKERCKQLMRQREDFIFNATNITSDLRSKWLNLFHEYGAKVTIHYIETPYDKLITQNNNREHVVPIKAIDKMISKLEIPQYNEAYDVKYNIDGEYN